MRTHRTSNLVPKLRFPEFQKDKEWNTTTLGKLGNFLTPLTGKSARHFDVGCASFVPYLNVFSNTFTDVKDLRSVDVSRDESQNAILKGDIFFTVSSETPEDVGMSSVLLEDIDFCYLNSFCALFRFDKGKKLNAVFVGFLLRSTLPRAHLSRMAQGATRYNISKSALRNIPLKLPLRSEQQKIADCLSTLDDLINAESQKLEALRTHKQGLMQQLFPQPGETVPRLRFSAFQDSEDWATERWGDFVSNRCVKFDPRESKETPCLIELENIESKTGRLLGVSELENQTSLKSRFQAGDVLYGKLRPYLQKFIRPNFDGVCTTEIWVLKSQRVSRTFLFYLVQTERFDQMANIAYGSRMPRADWSFLADANFQIPSKDEEEKVADCLSTIDELIEAESQKLEALRQHKKGLMQQLFPNTNR